MCQSVGKFPNYQQQNYAQIENRVHKNTTVTVRTRHNVQDDKSFLSFTRKENFYVLGQLAWPRLFMLMFA